MERQPHVVVIACPAQGHVGPLMKLSCMIADRGIGVTFVNAESIQHDGYLPENVELVSIPDGIRQLSDATDWKLVDEAMSRVMPRAFEDLLRKMKLHDDRKVVCVIADATFSWALNVAEKLGLKRAMFWPSAVRGFVLALSIPQLMEAKVIDDRGTPNGDGMIQFSKELPPLMPSDLIWTWPGDDLIKQEIAFRCNLNIFSTFKISDWLLCNSFYELDRSACDIVSDILPIGPLFACYNIGKNPGSLLSEDETCIDWLDKQPVDSVIYVAFGSIAALTQDQFIELAMGLELSERPFLWVVRQGFLEGKAESIGYPDGFLERVAGKGKMVSWAPQEKVLSHPSVTCFLSHCGWNSTIEALSYGIRILCWPQFTDQHYTRSYICNVLEVGLGLQVEEVSGVVSRHEIFSQLMKLLHDDRMKIKAEEIKDMAKKSVSKGGSSYRNFHGFIEQLKNC